MIRTSLHNTSWEHLCTDCLNWYWPWSLHVLCLCLLSVISEALGCCKVRELILSDESALDKLTIVYWHIVIDLMCVFVVWKVECVQIGSFNNVYTKLYGLWTFCFHKIFTWILSVNIILRHIVVRMSHASVILKWIWQVVKCNLYEAPTYI